MNSLHSLVVGDVFRLIVMVMMFDAPRQVFSFSTPRPHSVSRPLSIVSKREKSSGRKIRSSVLFSTSTTASTPAAEVANNLANIHSLNSITSNPHLFPVTSDYLNTLSRLKNSDSDRAGPLAQEFLSSLSRELLLLSQYEDAQTLEHTTSSARSEAFTAGSIDSVKASHHLVEVTAPAYASAFGVGIAAQTYDPASYSQYMNPIMVASTDRGGNSYWNGDSDWYGESAITASNSAAVDNLDVADTFASWHKSQGGSNALRDLALSIPIDDEMHQQSQQQLDFSHASTMGNMDYMSEQGVDAGTMASYNYLDGHDASSWYIPAHEQLGISFANNDHDESNYAWNSNGDGQDYYYHDLSGDSTDTSANMDGTVRLFDAPVTVSDQPSHLSHVNYDLSSSLTSDLSDLNYDGLSSAPPTLHHNGGLLSGDMIMSKLEELGLPRYHLELPVITNPFLDLSPSLQNAMMSIKQASEASRGKVEGYLNTMPHSLDELFGNAVDASESFESLSGQVISKVADMGASSLNAIGNTLQSGASSMAKIHPPSNMHLPLPNMNVIEGTSAIMNRIGDASLSDFGNVVLSTIKFTGGIIINFFGLIINAMSGTKIASVFVDAQSAVSSLIGNASNEVMSTLRHIGNMSVIEIIQHLMTLVIAISDILLKIMNAIIYLTSGKDGASWALLATSSIKESSSQLLAQATSTCNDFTHASLSELAHSIGDYGQVVGNEFVNLMGSLNGMPVSEDMFGSVASVLQTGLSL